MGYSTTFNGLLKFTKQLTKEERIKLKTFMGADCREHPEWDAKNLTWIDLIIDEYEEGIIWDGSEKTYDLVEKINLVLREMRKDFPDFGLKGRMYAQGESWDDHWALDIENGWAVKKETKITVDNYIVENKCPNCGIELKAEKVKNNKTDSDIRGHNPRLYNFINF